MINLMMISILSVEVSTAGIWVSIVSMVGIAKVAGISISMVGKSVSVSVVSVESISISLGLSSGSGLGISRPLAIVMSIVAGIWVSIVSMVGIAKMSISIVTIEVAGISRCVSLASSSGKHAQGDNSNGFHHFVACKLEDLARLKISLQALIFIPSRRP